MKRVWAIALVGVLCGVGLVPLEVQRGRAAAAGFVKMPHPGVLGRTTPLDCSGKVVELRFYDFVPEDEDEWKSLGVGVSGEPNFVLLVLLPERQFNVSASKVYIDANRNGWAEEVISFEEAYERWDGSWCAAYAAVRKGKP